jgi:hypothetical protein
MRESIGRQYLKAENNLHRAGHGAPSPLDTKKGPNEREREREGERERERGKVKILRFSMRERERGVCV